jgi:TldD protein
MPQRHYSDVRVFAEHSHLVRQVFRPDGAAERSVRRRLGACVDLHDPAGGVVHRFADGADLLREPPVPLAPAVRHECRRVQSLPLETLQPDTAQQLSALARQVGATLTWAAAHHQVACGDASAVHHDERWLSTVEVSLPDGTPGARHTRAVAWDGHVAPIAAAAEQLRQLQALARRDTVPAGCDLVLPPGRAGAFFHELVGHPMEADVMASGTSYLGRRLGERVAPAWLTVLDGATLARHGYRAAVDDEGTPCGTAAPLRNGVVTDRLTDLATARVLGLPPTGHGRRLDYRHLAIPRMSHTCAIVEPTTGGATLGTTGSRTATGGDDRWIEPLGLQLHTMSVLTGEFVFHARAAMICTSEGPAMRLPAVRLAGSGLRILAAIRPGPDGVGEYCRATGGCGKLGQAPLLVSFANAGLRIPAGTVSLDVNGG